MSNKWIGEERRHHNKKIDHEDRRQPQDKYNEEKSPSISLSTLGIVLGIIVSSGSIVGSVIALNDKYVTVEQQTQELTTLKNDIIKQQEDLSKAGKRLFIMMYEDQLDDIEFKIQNGSATEFEKAKKQRIERRIESIRRENF